MIPLAKTDYAVRSENYGQAVEIMAAEQQRQRHNLQELRQHNTELFTEAFQRLVSSRVALNEWEATRVKLAGAVPPGQLGDVLKALNEEVSEFLKQQEQKTPA